MPWYTGPTVLELLESFEVGTGRASELDFRLPIQYVIREHASDYRGYAGRFEAGSVAVGDTVYLDGGRTSTVTHIDRPEPAERDRKSTRLNSSHVANSYAVFC